MTGSTDLDQLLEETPDDGGAPLMDKAKSRASGLREERLGD
jgi:hypothetical protein